MYYVCMVWWMWTKTNNDVIVSTNAGHRCIKYVWSGGCGQRQTMMGSCRLMRPGHKCIKYVWSGGCGHRHTMLDVYRML